MGKTVFLNPGHGGSDPGAVANGFKEKDLNLAIAKACRDDLKRHGVTVVMGRDKDVDRTSGQIIEACNSSGADLAVDIHNNAGGGDGAEVYYYSGGGTSKTLANNILAEIKKVGQNSRGAKIKVCSDGSEYYYFIRETAMSAVIVECAFVDNREDMKIIDTAAEQKAMGVAIAKGILKTLGIAYKTATTTTATTKKPTTTTTKKPTTTKKDTTKNSPAKSYSKALAGTYVVTADYGLNIRKGAGTDNDVIVAIPKGTKVQNYGYYTTVSGVKWLYVQFTYNKVTYTGFCSSAYLKKA